MIEEIRFPYIDWRKTWKNRLPKNHFYQRRIVVSLRLALELI